MPSDANLNAVGWGDNGGHSPLCDFCAASHFALPDKKIEMVLSHREECSETEKHQTSKTMATVAANTNTTKTNTHNAFIKEQFGHDSVWTQSCITYADGSTYKGHIDRVGNRTGFGTYRTPIMLFGVYDPQNTASIVNWREYMGEWNNDEANGFGIMRRYRGDGTCTIEYEGQWLNGRQTGLD